MPGPTFTSESVTEGHPDKVADRISDSILDAYLRVEPGSRVACETLVTTNRIVIAGEVSSTSEVDVVEVARQAVADVGYTDPDTGFDAASCKVDVHLGVQSPDIAQGVDTSLESRASSSDQDEFARQGAGDQGIMFGYATAETSEYMPAPIHVAHRIAERLATVRHSGQLPYLRPDGKVQATFEYDRNDRPVRLDTVVVSAQHSGDVDLEMTVGPDMVEHVVKPALPPQFADDNYRVLVNPTGRFVIGGPNGDTGLTGRKIIVDTYGGMARHGGGAFSGKDPSKVDRSAAYAARWVAKNIVASGAAARCEIQVAYVIGLAHPVSVLLKTFGTEQVDPAKIDAAVREIFDLRPAAIASHLKLQRPIYTATTAYGHFGRRGPDFTWEKTDRVDDIRSALRL